MTDPRHLDDEDLSAALDGEDGDAGRHLAGCATCSARMGALRTAREAVAAAAVAPLAAAVLDGLVVAALAEPSAAAGAAPVVPVRPSSPRRRGRRLSGPPPAWLIGAAAGIAALAGLAGLLGSRTGGDDRVDATAGVERFEATTADEGSGAVGLPSGGAAAVATDPETVRGDLGDVDDPESLAVAVSGGAPTTVVGAARTSGDGAATDARSKSGDPEAAPSSPAAGPVGAGSAGATVDRAQCRADAERIGAGRLGALLSTSTLRWTGRPAEVLVFALAEPAGGFSRQALVLARPGCALLADPRF